MSACPAAEASLDTSLPTLALAVVLFAATNLDDIVLLLGFLADPKFTFAQVALGQAVGLAALFLGSVAAAMLAVAVAPAWIGLLGLVPIALGLRELWEWRYGDDDDAPVARAGAGNVATVAAVTIANGGDNLGVYIPLFATRGGGELAVIAAVFAVMTAAWLVAAAWLVRHPTLGAPIRRHGHKVVPFVLIALGVWIVVDAGTLDLLR